MHHGQANDEKSYIQQMSKFGIEGGLWKDFIAIYWVSKYSQCSIHVWNKNNGQIMMKVGNAILNIVYGNIHFEPTHLFDNDSNNINISRNITNDDRINFFTMCVMDINDKPRKTFYKTKKNYLDFPFR